MLSLPENKNLIARCFPIKKKNQLNWLLSIIDGHATKMVQGGWWVQFLVDTAMLGMGKQSIKGCFKGSVVISSIKDKVISQNFQSTYPNHF